MAADIARKQFRFGRPLGCRSKADAGHSRFDCLRTIRRQRLITVFSGPSRGKIEESFAFGVAETVDFLKRSPSCPLIRRMHYCFLDGAVEHRVHPFEIAPDDPLQVAKFENAGVIDTLGRSLAKPDELLRPFGRPR